MAKRRTGIYYVGLIVAAVALIIVGVAGFLVYMNVSQVPLHTNPQDVVSVTHSAPLPKWAGAVDEGRKIVRASVVQQNQPAISVAVGVSGDIVWAEGFGWANIENRQPAAPETKFRIGHASKALTSAGVGLLREQGKLHLDDEIQTYVPAFPKKQWPITLRELMAHTAGVHHYRDTEWGDKPTAHCERASEGLQSFANDPLMFEPETEYRYSTYGWVLVSAAIESVAGVPFFEFMQKQIFEPLGMSDTTYDAPAKSMPNRAASYYRHFLREVTTGVDYSCFAGGGAFLSTPSDLVRFGMAMNSGKLLQPATVSVLQTRQQLTSGGNTDYGLGWMLETVELGGERTQMASHASRTIEGASTSFLTFPERGLVVAVTSNMSFADMRSIAWDIAEIFAKASEGRK